MEARKVALLLAMLVSPAWGAGSRTRNFIVTAPTPQLAGEIAQAAEQYRHDLAIQWLGSPLPDWHQPCPIVVHLHRDAGGRTSFMFEQRVPFGWEMEIQGSRERMLDSVLPHEITHTIFATHFGRPLPRWADEGACTTVEHSVERKKQEVLLIQYLQTERGIPFNRMFAMTEYPGDIMPLYSQGYSLARFLIAQGGKPKFTEFVGAGMDSGDWNEAVRTFYGFESLGQLQVTWVDWVTQGSDEAVASRERADIELVSNETPVARTSSATSDHPLANGVNGYRTTRGTRPLIDHSNVAEGTGAGAGAEGEAGVEGAAELPEKSPVKTAAVSSPRRPGSWYARQ